MDYPISKPVWALAIATFRSAAESVSELNVVIGTRDDNPRLPLQYQPLEKRSPGFTRNGHDADCTFWPSLSLEGVKHACDEA